MVIHKTNQSINKALRQIKQIQFLIN